VDTFSDEQPTRIKKIIVTIDNDIILIHSSVKDVNKIKIIYIKVNIIN